MDVDGMWAFVERSGQAGAGRREREAFLASRLPYAPREDLLDFVQHLSATREPLNTYRMWNAAELIMSGWCSGDSFHYFQMWLVGLGRDVYDAAVAEPDSLAEVPAVRRLAALPEPWADDDYPEWESLEYVAVEVGAQRADIGDDVRDVVAAEREVVLRSNPNPDDAGWARLGDAETARRYPRLWALFSGRRKP